MTNTGILPEGVKLAPEARSALEHALSSLEKGMLITAWMWAGIAHKQLDELTEGPIMAYENDHLSKGSQ